MGWFWGSSASNDDDSNKSQDPLRSLDPSLREFLAKESPVKYNSSNPPQASAPPAAPQPKQATPSDNKTAQSQPTSSDDTAPKAPAESLFPDGRYAHLWKTYQSKSQVDAESKSDQEKINDILEGYNYRKAEIGRAALENCALEQWDVNECFQSGSIKSRLTMCRDENQKLDRCYTMQAKFLKALGYLSTFDRPAEVDEQIQMHADTLYHRMLDQEKLIEEAKAEGRPIPTFPPLISSSKTKVAKPAAQPVPVKVPDNTELNPADLPAPMQTSAKQRLEGLEGEERKLEEMAIKAEIQASEELAGHLGSIYEKQAEERRKRKEEGKERIGDKIQSLFGFR